MKKQRINHRSLLAKPKHRLIWSKSKDVACSCGWKPPAVHTDCKRAQLRKRIGPLGGSRGLSAGLGFREVRREEAVLLWGRHVLEADTNGEGGKGDVASRRK
jgi:hypothetical protein